MPATDASASPPPAEPIPSGYPKHWEVDAVLADGGTVHIRPVMPGDAAAVAAFHERQPPENIYFRFFTPHPRLSERELQRMTVVDYVDHMVFVALIGDDIVGMAGYDVWRSRTEADVWFLVDDEQRGRGLATILLEYLAAAARESGLSGLTAQVLPTNRRMLTVFRSAGFRTESAFEDGIIEVRLGIEPTPEALAAILERERLAEARSVERLLAPASIAVIGTSARRANVGRLVFGNLLRHGFTGVVYPVNARAEPVAGVRSYSDVLEIPDDIDLAVIAVPALAVLDVVEACGRRRVGALIIVSAGFSDYGPYGEAGERLVVERARRYGMRVIGPESLGVINTSPRISMHATVAGVEVTPGSVAFGTQSGTLGIAALEHAKRTGVGISSFVDMGSKVDVSGNDLLQYWEQDDRTKVIALHLESFGNPRKFTRLARRISRSKPIVAVQSHGHTVPVDRAGGHPASAWPIQATVDALLAQAGVVRVDTPSELFAVARALAVQPAPAGRRVAVLSNSRGATLLTVDALTASRLTLAELSARTRGELSARLPRGASVANPVDVTFRAGPDDSEAGLRALLEDEGVDACLVIYAPAVSERSDDVARALGRATVGSPRKPILSTFLGRDVASSLLSGDLAIPLFEFPSEAVRVLTRMVSYGEWCARPEGRVPDPGEFGGLDVDALRGRCSAVLNDSPDGRWLENAEAAALLADMGVSCLAHRVVNSRDEALAAATEIGFPVVLKATGLGRLRPGEAGGVALGLHDARDVEAAYDRMIELHGSAMRPAIVQRMAEPGVEVMCAFHQHASYGAVVTLGLGGPTTEANPQLPVRILPLTDLDARSLIADAPVGALIDSRDDGDRVADALVALLLRTATALEQVPEIADLVANPVFVGPADAMVADVRARVAPYRWEPSPTVRRLG